jgi:hypothetical protein
MRTSPAVGLALVLFLGLVATARASDHQDGPARAADAATDITDLYAWMAKDGATVNLVLDVYPNAPPSARFSNAALYAIHLRSQPGYGADASMQKDVLIVCSFTSDTGQRFTCSLSTVAGDVADAASGSVGNPAPAQGDHGKLQVFAGLRDDPFYFNQRGLRASLQAVKTAWPMLTPDAAGCPQVAADASGLFLGVLHTDGMGGMPSDDFAAGGATSGNVLSIVIAVDKAAVTPGGPIVGAWATTNKRR